MRQWIDLFEVKVVGDLRTSVSYRDLVTLARVKDWRGSACDGEVFIAPAFEYLHGEIRDRAGFPSLYDDDTGATNGFDFYVSTIERVRAGDYDEDWFADELDYTFSDGEILIKTNAEIPNMERFNKQFSRILNGMEKDRLIESTKSFVNDRSQRVFVNPSLSQLSNLVNQFEIRGLTDGVNVFVCDSMHMVHDDIAASALLAGLWEGAVGWHNAKFDHGWMTFFFFSAKKGSRDYEWGGKNRHISVAQTDIGENVVFAHSAGQLPRLAAIPAMRRILRRYLADDVDSLKDEDEDEAFAHDLFETDRPQLPVHPSPDSVGEVCAANSTFGFVGHQGWVDLAKLNGGADMTQPSERARVEALVERMKSATGYFARIIIDGLGNVVEGQHRFSAAQILGWKQVPVVQMIDTFDHVDRSVIEAVNAVRNLGDRAGQVVTNVAENIYEDGDMEGDYNHMGQWAPAFNAAMEAIRSAGGLKNLVLVDRK